MRTSGASLLPRGEAVNDGFLEARGILSLVGWLFLEGDGVSCNGGELTGGGAVSPPPLPFPGGELCWLFLSPFPSSLG